MRRVPWHTRGTLEVKAPTQLRKFIMITQVVQYQKLDEKYKGMLNADLAPERMIYIVMDNQRNVKSITTSVCNSISKHKNGK